METESIPWLFALLTAGWFGWMANRVERAWILWAVGGAAFGVVISTLALGLGRATSIPFSDHERVVDEAKWLVAAAVVIGAIGWLLTSSLHRHHLLGLASKSGPSPNEPLPMPVKPVPAPAGKASPGKAQS
jgi:hypothetical protein